MGITFTLLSRIGNPIPCLPTRSLLACRTTGAKTVAGQSRGRLRSSLRDVDALRAFFTPSAISRMPSPPSVFVQTIILKDTVSLHRRPGPNLHFRGNSQNLLRARSRHQCLRGVGHLPCYMSLRAHTEFQERSERSESVLPGAPRPLLNLRSLTVRRSHRGPCRQTPLRIPSF